MSAFTVLYAVHVPHYGRVEVEARTPATAIAMAKSYDPAEICTEMDWTGAAAARIVSITEDNGRVIAEDVALDGAFLRYGGPSAWLLCEYATELLDALMEMVTKADDLMGAISGSTHHYDPLIEHLSAASNRAETAIAKARGEL